MDLAALCGVTQVYIYQLESGRANPSMRLVGRLREALGCSADELMAAEEVA